MPLPHPLRERLRRLKERKKARPHDLVFGNTKGRPDSELDMVVKKVAERAGLNCGRCVTKHGNKMQAIPMALDHVRENLDLAHALFELAAMARRDARRIRSGSGCGYVSLFPKGVACEKRKRRADFMQISALSLWPGEECFACPEVVH